MIFLKAYAVTKNTIAKVCDLAAAHIRTRHECKNMLTPVSILMQVYSCIWLHNRCSYDPPQLHKDSAYTIGCGNTSVGALSRSISHNQYPSYAIAAAIYKGVLKMSHSMCNPKHKLCKSHIYLITCKAESIELRMSLEVRLASSYSWLCEMLIIRSGTGMRPTMALTLACD